MTSPPIRTLEINININKADTHAHAEVYLTRYVSRATWPVDVSLRKWLALASCKFARNFKDDAVGFFFQNDEKRLPVQLPISNQIRFIPDNMANKK